MSPDDRDPAVAGTSAQPSVDPPTDPAETLATTPLATPHAAAIAAPERQVVDHPPPQPDYPCYRVEPGELIRLAQVNPDETEQYHGKKAVADELQRQRDRIRDLQARLYAERRQSLLIVLQAMDTGGKD